MPMLVSLKSGVAGLISLLYTTVKRQGVGKVGRGDVPLKQAQSSLLACVAHHGKSRCKRHLYLANKNKNPSSAV